MSYALEANTVHVYHPLKWQILNIPITKQSCRKSLRHKSLIPQQIKTTSANAISSFLDIFTGVTTIGKHFHMNITIARTKSITMCI